MLSFLLFAYTVTVSAVEDNFPGENGEKFSQQNSPSYTYGKSPSVKCRDINLTLGLLSPRRHVVWRDSVGVESSGSGLKIRVRGYFASELSLLLRHTDEPQKGRNSCLWLQSRSVLSSFGVLLMSCRVKFHVVRSALQYSACRI